MRLPDPKYAVLALAAPHENEYMEMPLLSRPIAEETLLQKSLEYFSNPAPCQTHRSAVAARIYDELMEALAASGNGELSLSPTQMECFSLTGKAKILLKNRA